MCVRKPTAERFPDKEYYDMAISRWHKALDRLSDFKNEVSDEVMKEEYGEWYLRSIGIDIACYDVDNKKLKYPIKITDKILDYDDVPASESALTRDGRQQRCIFIIKTSLHLFAVVFFFCKKI